MGVRKDEGIVPMEERLVAANTSRYKIVKNDWFAYNPMRLNIGSIARWRDEEDVLVSPDYVVFRCRNKADPTGLLPAYLDHFRQTKQWDAFVNGSGDGGVRVRIYYRDLARMRMLLPDLAEQEKIAAALSSIDGLIDAENCKLQKLKEYKRGLLQCLFPVPGEANPRLRFPTPNNDGDWREINLGAILDGAPNYGVNAPAVPYTQNLPTYLRITDISEDGRFLDENKMSVEVEANPDNTMQVGDIALVRTGASVGKSYIHIEKNGPLVFAGFLIRIRINHKEFSPRYIFQFLRSDRYWMWVEKTSKRSGQPGLNSSEYASLIVPMPGGSSIDSLQQQSRIADFLSSIDNKIEAQSNVVSELRAHKSGLMQLLFPVSGVLER